MNGLPALSIVRNQKGLIEILNERYNTYILSPTVFRIIGSDNPIRRIEPQVQYDILIREALQDLSGAATCPTCIEETAVNKLKAIIASTGCPIVCRSWSNYLLGIFYVKRAKENGDLKELWENSANTDIIPESLAKARSCFGEALNLLGSSCDNLKRNIQRSLALVLGPGSPDKIDDMASCLLINSSVGAATRRCLLKSLTSKSDKSLDRAKQGKLFCEIFNAIDYNPSIKSGSERVLNFFEELGRRVLPEWRFITLVLCPTGELIMTKIEFECINEKILVSHRTSCVFPESGDDNSVGDIYSDILEPLDEIVRRSQKHLSKEFESTLSSETLKEDELKRKWWSERKASDNELEDHLQIVQQRLLMSVESRLILLGCNGDSFHISCGNLASKFEAASIDEGGIHSFNLDDMKVAQLKSELSLFGYKSAQLRSMKKSELVDLVRKNRHANQSEMKRVLDASCTFLILDENLQRFPFEGLPLFENKTVCRLPSLPFVLVKLKELEGSGKNAAFFDPVKTSFVLDPESDLTGTRDRIFPLIQSLSMKHGNTWLGVVGSEPSVDFIKNSMLTENSLLLYFGHGGGQKFISRKKIEELICPHISKPGRRQISSSLILMGCSSGRLESVNSTINRNFGERIPLYYEPEGIALSYLMAGAPCVVGNLWDVTDHDIDRFSVRLMEKIFTDDDVCDSSISIAQGVAEARSACKLRSIVGCAPVCYGLPVVKLQSNA